MAALTPSQAATSSTTRATRITIRDSSVNVDAPVTGATRSLPSRAGPGAELTVTISASNYGSFGQVVETLPPGFSYVDDSTDPSDIRTSVSGQDITFTLLGANVSFSYKVTAASSGGTHTFEGGNLIDDQGNPHTILDSSVTVDAPVTGATRRLPGRVNPGAELTVTISASNYGSFGQVVETLPPGFSYVDDSTDPSDIRTSVSGQDITFTLLGANVSFSYKVTAASSGGTHTFEGGNLIDDQGNPHTIRDSSVNVDAPVTGATRRLPGRVNPGAELTVTISASNYGSFGQVVETLPAGFSYVDDSTDPSDIRTSVTGQDITFTLLGANVSFSYKAMATSTQATYTFEGGKLIDDQGNPPHDSRFQHQSRQAKAKAYGHGHAAPQYRRRRRYDQARPHVYAHPAAAADGHAHAYPDAYARDGGGHAHACPDGHGHAHAYSDGHGSASGHPDAEAEAETSVNRRHFATLAGPAGGPRRTTGHRRGAAACWDPQKEGRRGIGGALES